jgi:glycosyltransferase involved in cell wall biosynthesis
VNVLLEALSLLSNKDISVSIIGDGPEKGLLEKQAEELGLNSVVFAGIKKGHELVMELNAHKIMVIPSTWPEPYGIVALEGMACGCLIVASNQGGLSEAVGRFGILYNNNNPIELAAAIQEAVDEQQRFINDYDLVNAYLQTKLVDKVAQQYLDYFKTA